MGRGTSTLVATDAFSAVLGNRRGSNITSDGRDDEWVSYWEVLDGIHETLTWDTERDGQAAQHYISQVKKHQVAGSSLQAAAGIAAKFSSANTVKKMHLLIQALTRYPEGTVSVPRTSTEAFDLSLALLNGNELPEASRKIYGERFVSSDTAEQAT